MYLAILIAGGMVYLLPLLFFGLKLTGLNVKFLLTAATWLLGAFCATFLLLSPAVDQPLARMSGQYFFAVLIVWMVYSFFTSFSSRMGAIAVVSSAVTLGTCIWLFIQGRLILSVPNDGQSRVEVPMLMTARIIGGAIVVIALLHMVGTQVPGAMNNGADFGSTLGNRFTAALILLCAAGMAAAPADLAAMAALGLGGLLVLGAGVGIYQMSAAMAQANPFLAADSGLGFIIKWMAYGAMLYMGCGGTLLMWWLSCEIKAPGAGDRVLPVEETADMGGASAPIEEG